MKTKKVPMRKCLGCQTSKPKKELIRIVRTPEGEICVDFTGKLNGRGAYICPDPMCLKNAVKAKRLESAFETQISSDVTDALASKLSEISGQ